MVERNRGTDRQAQIQRDKEADTDRQADKRTDKSLREMEFIKNSNGIDKRFSVSVLFRTFTYIQPEHFKLQL